MLTRTSFLQTIARAGVLWGCTILPAAAADLTGTWEGTATCSLLEQGTKKEKLVVKDARMEISQSGSALNVRALSPTTGQPKLLDGVIVDDGSNLNKGEAGLVVCDSSVEPIDAAGGWIKVTINPKTNKGTLTGLMMGAQDTSKAQVGTCRLNFKRTNLTDPAIPGCL